MALSRTLALVSLMALCAGCITVRGDLTPQTLPSASERREKGLGFVGLSLDFKFVAARAVPRLELEVENVETGKRTKFMIDKGLTASGGSSPLLFALEKGRYWIRKAVLRIPGGDYEGQRYNALEIDLKARTAAPFDLEAGEFLHLGHQELDVTLVSDKGAVTAHHSQGFRAGLPSSEAWEPLLAPILPSRLSYLRKASEGAAIEKRKWEKEKTTATSGTAASFDAIREKEMDTLLTKVGFEVRKCARAHLPTYKGTLEMEVLISAEGSFDGAEFKAPQWTSSAPARECVQKFLSAQRVSARGDGRSNTWTLNFEIR